MNNRKTRDFCKKLLEFFILIGIIFLGSFFPYVAKIINWILIAICIILVTFLVLLIISSSQLDAMLRPRREVINNQMDFPPHQMRRPKIRPFPETSILQLIHSDIQENLQHFEEQLSHILDSQTILNRYRNDRHTADEISNASLRRRMDEYELLDRTHLRTAGHHNTPPIDRRKRATGVGLSSSSRCINCHCPNIPVLGHRRVAEAKSVHPAPVINSNWHTTPVGGQERVGPTPLVDGHRNQQNGSIRHRNEEPSMNYQELLSAYDSHSRMLEHLHELFHTNRQNSQSNDSLDLRVPRYRNGESPTPKRADLVSNASVNNPRRTSNQNNESSSTNRENSLSNDSPSNGLRWSSHRNGESSTTNRENVSNNETQRRTTNVGPFMVDSASSSSAEEDLLRC